MTPPVAAGTAEPRPARARVTADGITGRAPVLVLGVGNELFTDEGLGCVAAERVRRRLAAAGVDGVDVRDGSTLGLGLLPELADRRAVLLLDAILSDGAAPGDVVVLEGDDVPMTRRLTVSAHQIGVSEALAAAQFAGCCPDVVAAAGIVPAVLETGVGLSPAVEASMDALVEAALGILHRWTAADGAARNG